MPNTNSAPENPAENAPVNEDSSPANSFLEQGKNMFDEHKGKLAIGVAATLGAMVFYNWLEKQLAKEDPEGHARLQRLKAVFRADDINVLPEGHDYYDEGEANLASPVMNGKTAEKISAAR
jgi:hypothetical protein